VKITDSARDSLKQLLQEQNAAGIRVYFAGIS
jgi:Fe-S cluster assembly iron-binding protein IscA